MKRFLTTSGIALVLLAAVPACTAQDKLEEDIKALSTALGDAESDEQSVQLLKDFLKEHPDTKYTAPVLDAIAYYQGSSLGDREGAAEFIAKHIELLEDQTTIRNSKVVLAGLYGAPKHREKLRELSEQLLEAGGLTYHNFATLIDASFGAEDWELALELVEPAKKTSTLEAVKGDYPNATDEKAEERSRLRASDLAAYEGWALANTGETAKAIELFERADEGVRRNYFDVPDGMVNVYWGRTLMMKGEAEAALEKLLPSALWAANEDAVEAAREIYLAQGGSPEDFEDYLFEKRLETAKEIDDFTAADYEGRDHSSKDLMGRVTLLAFWFPT